jgi:hypothetical protein
LILFMVHFHLLLDSVVMVHFHFHLLPDGDGVIMQWRLGMDLLHFHLLLDGDGVVMQRRSGMELLHLLLDGLHAPFWTRRPPIQAKATFA